MNDGIQLLGWGCIVIAIVIAITAIGWSRWHSQRMVNTIEQMLKDATNGSFMERVFDESRISALETRFANYLAASMVSAHAIAAERDKIKTLISDLSHQTKTPIANLLLYSELLEEEELSESTQYYVKALHNQIVKLHFLIDSLVKLSRLENGILTVSARSQPLYPLLENVYEQFLPSAKEKGIELSIESMDIEDMKMVALFDRKWTAEALCNILDNAIKYTKQGNIKISITAYEMFVRIDIADTGIGISEQEQAKIFLRFYRAEAARDSEGVGVGLYLAREIISSEGGYIKVTSVCGKGSTFSVFLPRA